MFSHRPAKSNGGDETNGSAAAPTTSWTGSRLVSQGDLDPAEQLPSPGSLAESLLESVRKPRPPWSIEAFAAFIAVVAVGWAAWGVFVGLRHLLWWGAVASLLYFALAPAVDWLAARRWPRGLASLTVLLALAGLSVALLAALTPLVVAELERAIKEAPAILARARSVLSAFGLDLEQPSNTASLQGILSQAREALPSVAGGDVALTSKLLGTLLAAFVIWIFTFLLLAGQDRLRCGVLSRLRPRTAVIVSATWDDAVSKTGGYLYARTFTAFVAGTFIGVALAILGCPYPVALAVWYGLVSQFIPMIGTYLAASLPILILLFHNPWDALWFVVVLAVWVPLQDHLIGPRLSAKTMALSPAAAIIALILGFEVIGALGAFLALPAAAVIQSVASAFFTRHEVMPVAATRRH